MVDYSDIEILELVKDADLHYTVYDYSSITGTYLDLVSSNLVYQFSSENIRKAMGNFFFITNESSYDKPVFSAKSIIVRHEDDIRGINMAYINPLSNKITKLETNSARITSIDNSVLLPNLKIPFRMYADPETVFGDVFWREYITGGTYGGDQFSDMANVEDIYYDIAISFKTPIDYRVRRAYEYLNIDPDGDLSIYEVKCQYKDYNKFVANYQAWATGLESELLIPNYNIIVDHFAVDYDIGAGVSAAADAGAAMEEIQLYRRMGENEPYSSVMSYNIVPNTDPDIFSVKKDQYYGNFFVNHTQSEELKENVIRHQRNIIFAHEYFDYYFKEFGDEGLLSDTIGPDGSLSLSEKIDTADIQIEKRASTFYNVQINFTRHKVQNFEHLTSIVPPPGTKQPILDNLELGNIDQPSILPGKGFLVGNDANNAGGGIALLIGGSEPNYTDVISAKILEMIKDIDQGAITDVPVRTQNFGYANNFKKIITENGLPINLVADSDLPSETVGLKSINYIQLLNYIYNNYDSAINDNYIFMGPQRPEYTATLATNTLYKNKLSQDVLKAMNGAISRMKAYFQSINTDMIDLDDIGDESMLEGDLDERAKRVFEKVLSPTKKFYEVMAYKIEKIAGPPTGDSSTQDVVQTFWVYNSPSAPDVINITDSQVKYGKRYTYKISAYALVMSHKYKYSDFRLTKQIGTGQKFDVTDPLEEPKFCLQFYNPENNQVASQIFTTTVTSEDDPLLEYVRSIASVEQEFATDQIDISTYPQLADFNLYIEPCLEIVEIPFAAKSVNVLDSPPNAINVTPFHFIDESNRLGFKIGQDSFIERPYPELITETDVRFSIAYFKSRELALYENIVEPSQSPARYIEMYRIDKKPKAFTDFMNGLVSTIDLRIPNEDYNYSDYIMADQIIPNKKYYYVFRLLNENFFPGPLSQIIEAQLTNDGGYVYSTFDKIDSSEFSSNKTETKIKTAKKIFQLEPNINQLKFNTSDVDFSRPAAEQVKNIIVGTVSDGSIWDGKKFKIRLTSKKTGRKVDLNTSFNLRIKDLSKEAEAITIEVDESTGDSPALGPTVPVIEPIPPMPDDSDMSDMPSDEEAAASSAAAGEMTTYGTNVAGGEFITRSQADFLVNGSGALPGLFSMVSMVVRDYPKAPYSAAKGSGPAAIASELGMWLKSVKDVPITSFTDMSVFEIATILSFGPESAGYRDFYSDYDLTDAARPENLGIYESDLFATDELRALVRTQIYIEMLAAFRPSTK